MAYDQSTTSVSLYTAAADLSSYQYYAVYQSGDSAVNLATTAGGPVLGILANKPESGQSAEVMIGGIVSAKAGAAFAAGAKLTNDTTGRLVTASDDDYVLAQAVSAATAAGQVISVILLHEGQGKQPLRLTDSGAGVTAKTFVKLNTSGEVLTATEGSQAIGVAAATVAAAGTVQVQTSGTVLVTAGTGGVTAGDLVAPSATGTAVQVDTLGVAAGIALTTAAAGSDATVLLLPVGVQDYMILPAAADYSSAEKQLVDVNTSGQAVIVSSAGGRFVGVLMNQPAAGEDALVRIAKVAKVYTGAAVTAGSALAANSSGEAITATTGTYCPLVALETDAVGNTEIKAAFLPASPETYGNYFLIQASVGGAIGAATVSPLTDFEYPRDFTVVAGYADLLTAPGGADTVGVTLTQGGGVDAVIPNIAAAAVHAEDKTLSVAMGKNTDTDVVVVSSAGTAADLNCVFVCRERL